MKTLICLGTRPEIIRLSQIIPKLDKVCKNILVHTGQNFDANMSDIFFQELNIRKPDYYLGVKSESFGGQLGKIEEGIEKVITKEKPDRFLVLGDTNSALSAFMAKRMGVEVYHMEAGNRCFSDLVPEEINRRVVDTCSDVHMPYTERSRANLIQAGYPGNKIFVTGNPIYEILLANRTDTEILNQLNLTKDKYILVTAHRQENVDNLTRLIHLLSACDDLMNAYKVPLIFSRHPRTKKKMELVRMNNHKGITFHEPFGLLDFLTLERNALLVVTDSGTVQEECCILHVRCVTIRDVTERPETIECGSNILSGINPESILRCAKVIMSQNTYWNPPPEYVMPNVSGTVVRIVTGY